MFHDGFMGGMWYGWIIGIVIVVFIVWLIVNQSNKNKQDPQISKSESALDVLKKRYAKGEITKEQFEEMKKELNKLT